MLRKIDKNSLLDLIGIAYEQVSISNKIDDLLNCEFNFPESEKLFDIVLDAMGAPADVDERDVLQELFYSNFVTEKRFKNVSEFYETLLIAIDDSKNES